MAEQKAAFIKVPTDLTNGFQTMPVEPSRRLPESDIRIELCTEHDATKIAEGLYLCFPDDWWAKKEPLDLRPQENSNQIRIQRMAARLTPAMSGLELLSSPSTTLEQVVAKRFAKMKAMIQRILGVPTPIKKKILHNYTDSPFIDSIFLVEMPKKLSFPNMKMYDGTTDPTDHIASYKQCMFVTAILCEQREACMCKSFGSSLQGPVLQW